MIGIYKITSPTGRIYIGQSINIIRRFKDYSNLNYCKSQTKLYHSLKKYGYDNHKFEVIEECNIIDLNNRERYWQEYYDVLDQKKGLNYVLVKCDNKKSKFSIDTKIKMSKSNIGKKISIETRLKLSMSKKGKCTGSNNGFFGKKHTEKTRKHISENHKNKGNKPIPRKGSLNNRSKLVLDSINGIYYETMGECCYIYNIKRTTLGAMLSGQNPNKTNLIYV